MNLENHQTIANSPFVVRMSKYARCVLACDSLGSIEIDFEIQTRGILILAWDQSPDFVKAPHRYCSALNAAATFLHEKYKKPVGYESGGPALAPIWRPGSALGSCPYNMTAEEFWHVAVAIVPPDQASRDPYPIVFVSKAGRVREVDHRDRNYLETYFVPEDSNRPTLEGKIVLSNPSETVEGYCARSSVPVGCEIVPEQVVIGRTEIINRIKEMTEKAGLEFSFDENGNPMSSPPQKPKRWWLFNWG